MTSVVLLIKYAHMPCYMSRSAWRGMHACPCHHLFVGFPVDGHISIGDTKDIFCFILQSVDSVQELVCFCCLFEILSCATCENNYSQHAHLLKVSRNIFASVDENAEINLTMNTTGICQWC